jgi:hypothetical protein
MLIRREVFEAVGELGQEYFLCWEELDLAERARKAGFCCVTAPQARMWHKVSSSFGGEASPLRTYFNTRNRLLWAERHLAGRQRWAVCAGVLRELKRIALPPMRMRRLVSRPPRQAYWEVAAWLRSCRAAISAPQQRAKRLGVLDYCLRRFGACRWNFTPGR